MPSSLKYSATRYQKFKKTGTTAKISSTRYQSLPSGAKSNKVVRKETKSATETKEETVQATAPETKPGSEGGLIENPTDQNHEQIKNDSDGDGKVAEKEKAMLQPDTVAKQQNIIAKGISDIHAYSDKSLFEFQARVDAYFASMGLPGHRTNPYPPEYVEAKRAAQQRAAEKE